MKTGSLSTRLWYIPVLTGIAVHDSGFNSNSMKLKMLVLEWTMNFTETTITGNKISIILIGHRNTEYSSQLICPSGAKWLVLTQARVALASCQTNLRAIETDVLGTRWCNCDNLNALHEKHICRPVQELTNLYPRTFQFKNSRFEANRMLHQSLL